MPWRVETPMSQRQDFMEAWARGHWHPTEQKRRALDPRHLIRPFLVTDYPVLTPEDRSAIERLCDEALELHRSAVASTAPYREIQETLLAFTLRMESSAQNLRSEQSLLRRDLSVGPRRTKKESSLIKARLQETKSDIESCSNALRTLKIIGDTVAFAVMDAWDIKPFAFKEDPGYLSGKVGLEVELDAFRLGFRAGGIAILNDLTTCLRHGDVTFLNPATGELALFEAKSNPNNTSNRTVRQKEAADKVLAWLDTDLADGLYGLPGWFVRGAAHSAPHYNTALMQQLVEKARAMKVASGSPESGLTYVATTEFAAENVEDCLASCKGEPVVALLGASTPWPPAHRPVSLLLGSGSSLIDFLSGELVLIVVLDSGELVSGFERRGWRVAFDPEKERPVELYHSQAPGDNPQMSIGGHMYGRLFTEALSLDWFTREASSVPEPPPGIHDDNHGAV
jgi:hypothetical protein